MLEGIAKASREANFSGKQNPSIDLDLLDRLPTFAEIEGPQSELLLPLASLHLHGAEGGVDSEVATADGPHILRRDGGAVESAAASGEPVRAELAGRIEVAVNVLAGFALLCTRNVSDGGGHACHRERRLGRC